MEFLLGIGMVIAIALTAKLSFPSEHASDENVRHWPTL